MINVLQQDLAPARIHSGRPQILAFISCTHAFDGAMDDTADIPAARDGMTRPVRRCAFTSGWNTAVARGPTFDLVGLHLRNS